MALIPFKGISFNNPGAICYCNSVINAVLSSNNITKNITPYHCAYCSFLCKKFNDSSLNQSSMQLKNWIAQLHPEFSLPRHQDPAEFMNCLILKCYKLTQLTRRLVWKMCPDSNILLLSVSLRIHTKSPTTIYCLPLIQTSRRDFIHH